jgi:hypothetical protein
VSSLLATGRAHPLDFLEIISGISNNQRQKTMRKIIQLTLNTLSIALLSSCATCKIEPPPTAHGTDKEGAAKLAAGALPAKIANAEVSGNFKSVVNDTFVTVGQDDMAFYLLLEAYECESGKPGHKQQAEEVLQLAREELARRHGGSPKAVASHPTKLTPAENRALTAPLKSVRPPGA